MAHRPIASLARLVRETPLVDLPCGVDGCHEKAVVHCKDHDAGGDLGGGMYCAKHDCEAHHLPHVHVRENWLHGFREDMLPDTCLSNDGRLMPCELHARCFL